MFLASSLDDFRLLFVNKLIAMLSPDELGAYILVLANSIQDDAIRELLAGSLQENEKTLAIAIKDKTLRYTQDDGDVFEKLGAIDAGQLSSWVRHKVGVWDVVSNPFRSLRPSRASSVVATSIAEDFSQHTFDFNKDFLDPEVLWQGCWQDEDQQSFSFRVLYNKFPFIPYHTLIVPDHDSECPQYLTQRYHFMMWQLVLNNQRELQGFGAGFNSLGACASVNHLHFHGFIQSEALPVESARWVHNGGTFDYPMSCFAKDDKQQAWDLIAQLHDRNMPYNVLYRAGRCYVLPRKMQGDAGVLDAVSGAGWAEECGLFVATDESEVEMLTEEIITDNLRSLSVPRSTMADFNR